MESWYCPDEDMALWIVESFWASYLDGVGATFRHIWAQTQLAISKAATDIIKHLEIQFKNAVAQATREKKLAKRFSNRK